MFSDFINRFRMISLKWKLLIPYLFFSFVGTTSLVLIGLSSQQEIIKEEEKKELLRYYDIFQVSVRQKAEQALAMATVIAEDPIIEDLLWKQDRSGLLDYVQPLFEKLKKDFGIKQLHFHILPGKSYLRVHKPEQSGEMIAYRTSIMDVLKTGQGAKSLEWGLTGLGIRGIAPVYRNKELAGSMEIGYPFGRSFLEKQTKRWGPDFSVYEKRGPHTYTLLASTKKSGKKFSPSESLAADSLEKTQIFIAPPGFPGIALLAGPLRELPWPSGRHCGNRGQSFGDCPAIVTNKDLDGGGRFGGYLCFLFSGVDCRHRFYTSHQGNCGRRTGYRPGKTGNPPQTQIQ